MIPKYVEKLLQRRCRLAEQLQTACVDLDEYCEKIGVNVYDRDIPLGTHVMIYCEPRTSMSIVRDAIEDKLRNRRSK